MKLKLDFKIKVPKVAEENEVILLKDKTNGNKLLKFFNKSLFNNKLFLERKILAKNINNKTYIIVNSSKSVSALDYEKLGSELYIYLKNNKIENSYFVPNSTLITNVQLEKFLHGAQLKSCEFNVYKTDKAKNEINNLYVVESNEKSNALKIN